MKKSSFVAMILGTLSGLLFALGMCMTLLTEWNTFTEGIIFGAVGLVLGLVTLILWRKMENKAPINLNKRFILYTALAIIGILILGIGMCFCLIWDKIIIGTIIGIIGIISLLSLIPLMKGVK